MASKKRLTIEVNGGLCSRLRAVIGGMAWCDKNDATMIVNWSSREPNYPDGFEARLSDLWKFGGEITEIDRAQRKSKDPNALSQNSPFLRTCHIEHFLPYFTPESNPMTLMRRYHLSDAVCEYYRTIKIVLPPKVVGIHVRHDIKQPGTADPEWFIERMSQFPEKQMFFLSCDSHKVSTMIHSSFPYRVFELPKDYRYNKAGIQKSMADLYVLADLCQWVIGANYSSYSQMCCLMRGGYYIGPHDRPHGVSGGMYEDMWNPPNEQEFQEATDLELNWNAV